MHAGGDDVDITDYLGGGADVEIIRLTFRHFRVTLRLMCVNADKPIDTFPQCLSSL